MENGKWRMEKERGVTGKKKKKKKETVSFRRSIAKMKK